MHQYILLLPLLLAAAPSLPDALLASVFAPIVRTWDVSRLIEA
jgi:hypothetical protein